MHLYINIYFHEFKFPPALGQWKKIIYAILFFVMILSVVGFEDKISYLGIGVRNSTDSVLYNGTYTITS